MCYTDAIIATSKESVQLVKLAAEVRYECVQLVSCGMFTMSLTHTAVVTLKFFVAGTGNVCQAMFLPVLCCQHSASATLRLSKRAR